jgi:extracellular factor (EF) 3-hydroxypalmitic acid methyl ester biosynthesis protein
MFHSICEMNQSRNKNGNGNGAATLIREFKKKAATSASAPSSELATSAVAENGVAFKTSEGVTLRGTLAHIQRHAAVFELFSPMATPRLSEALADFKIILQEREVYSGRAVVSNVVDAGTKIVCATTLDAMDWADLNLLPALEQDGGVINQYNAFLNERSKNYKILPEFKVVVADMQSYLYDVRQWLEKLELNTQAFFGALQKQLEYKIATALSQPISESIDAFIERFESIAKTLNEEESQWAHRIFMRRQLHPLLLCAPFVNHTFTKPHGYAGDYEAVNMIVRNQFEGDSLYSKIVNYWFLQQPPAEAHRNRIEFLCENLVATAARVTEEGRTVRVANLGCGPAHEVQKFVRECHLADLTEFTLIDFESRALTYTEAALHAVQRKYERDCSYNMVKKSVSQILKEAEKKPAKSDAKKYDLVYCAGLFDYLADPVCIELTRVLYDWVAPGGLLITTNVDVSNPRRLTMDYLLEWHLIYRNQNDMMALKPDNIPEDLCRVRSDATGVNIYFEAQKPKDA